MLHLFQVTFRHGPHGEIKTCYVATCGPSSVAILVVNQEFGPTGRVYDAVAFQIEDQRPSSVPGVPRMCFRGDVPIFVDLQRYAPPTPGPCQCAPQPFPFSPN